VKILDSNNFNEEIAKGTVVVDFYADWCGPCKMLGPIIEELASDYEGRASICKLNVDDNSEIAKQYGVMSIPTVIVFKDGEVKETVMGFKPKQALSSVIDSNL